MIPKKIHYCWFGGAEKNNLIKKCIDSWKNYFPDFEIIEWNEKNFNIYENEYIKEAYMKKKYAFVSDFARLKIIYENGGIYFDTDIEVIKNYFNILTNGPFIGCEEKGVINTGLGFGAEKGNLVIKLMLDEYKNKKFIINDGLDLTPCTIYNTKILKELGWSR